MVDQGGDLPELAVVVVVLLLDGERGTSVDPLLHNHRRNVAFWFASNGLLRQFLSGSPHSEKSHLITGIHYGRFSYAYEISGRLYVSSEYVCILWEMFR